jgi:hypothetical protein
MTGTFIFYETSFDEVANLTTPGKKFWDGEMDWFIIKRFFAPEQFLEGSKDAWRVKMTLEAL